MNPYIINVRNGLYNVLENTLSPHTPKYYSTVQLSMNYDEKADCPLFKRFLEESMGGDMEQVALLQEILGYFLIPINSAQKCFVIVGVAGAGKSLLLRVVNADELQQYREESDSVLSFIKERCEFNASYSVGSTELFNSYKTYCAEYGVKPYAQKNFVQQMTTAFPDVTRGTDNLGKRRVLNGIKLGDITK